MKTTLLLAILLAGPKPQSSSVAPENAVLALAAADLRALDRDSQVYTRYVWITSGAFEDLQAVSVVLNLLSRNNVPLRPVPVQRGRLLLGRFDVRWYAPREGDLRDWLAVWEELRFDPRFNLLLTKDTLRFLALEQAPHRQSIKWELIDCEPYEGTAEDGTKAIMRKKWVQRTTEEAVQEVDDREVLRQVSPHLDKSLISFLVQATQSQAPVVDAGYFIQRGLTQQQGQEPFATIFGGLYYRFKGIRKAKQGTDLDLFLADRGLKGKKDLFDQLRSDERVAMIRSAVSGKKRQAEIFPLPVTRLTAGMSIGSLTHDVRQRNIDIGRDPIMNLLELADDAQEGIFTNAMGLHDFVLFNGKDQLQDVVPQDIANDRLIPNPHDTELEPAISCIHCHWKEGGWKRAENSVPKIVKPYLDIFDDLSRRDRGFADNVSRLAGLYAGDWEALAFPRARDDLARAVLKAAGPFAGANKTQTDIVAVANERIWNLYRAYRYDLVTPALLLRDLGIDPWQLPPGVVLRRFLPPVRPVAYRGFIPEDPRIAAWFAGLGNPRTDWALTYSQIATRVYGVKK